MGYLDKDFVYFDVIATLSDGSKVTTDGEKHLHDYVFKISGGELNFGNKFDLVDYGLYNTGEGNLIDKNRFRPDQFYTKNFVNDQVKISVRSKYQKFSKDFFYTMPYDLKLAVDMSGKDGIEGAVYPKNWGSDAQDYIIKVGMTKHKTTGEELVCYTFIKKFGSNSKEEVKSIVKTKPNIELFFDGSGGSGYRSASNNSGIGGNGAKVSVLVDPSAKTKYNINFRLSFGSGSYGGKNGKKGSYTITEEIVTVPNNY